MSEEQQKIEQYIANLRSQLKVLESKLEDMSNTPRFVRVRKGMEESYLTTQTQVDDLKEKIRVSITRAAEMLAMEEAQSGSQKLGEGMQRTLKIVAIGSGVLLVAIIVGAVIYKKVKKGNK
jgi:hypothetical protein